MTWRDSVASARSVIETPSMARPGTLWASAPVSERAATEATVWGRKFAAARVGDSPASPRIEI
jgi:hypothetical protein